MIYYKRNLLKYSSKTAHLSPLEHGIYNLIVDAYYKHEIGPTKAEAYRWVRAKTAAENRALMAVLGEFFMERDGRYASPDIDADIVAYRLKAAKNREIAVNREASRRAGYKHETCTERSPQTHETCTKRQPIRSRAFRAKAPASGKSGKGNAS